MIDTKALRSRVLDLAIQGKLTEQFESDGTAADLLHSLPKVSTKRAGLLKKNISCNIDYDVPDNWVLAKLGEISSYGDAPNKAVVSECDADTWILELEEIQAGGKLLTKKRVGNSTSIGEKTHFKAGQVLYSKLRPYLKKVLVADEDGICTPEMIAFDVYADIDPNYMVFCLINSYVDKAINDRSYGVKMPRVDAAFMVNLPIPIPPLSEQKRIVARVEEIFRLLDIIDAAQEQYAADAESLKAKLITLGIQGRLTEQLDTDGTAEELYQQIQAEKQRLIKEGKIKREKPLPEISDDEIPFEIPENWKWVRLKSLGQFSSGKTPSMSEPAFWNGSVAWVTSKDMKKTIITDSEMHITELAAEDMKIHPAGTLLLVARSGILRHSLPLCVLGVDSTINQDIKAFSLHDLSLSKWVYYALKGLEPLILKEYVKAMTTVESLKFEEFSSMPIPLPPLAEQKRIAETLERVLGVLG